MDERESRPAWWAVPYYVLATLAALLVGVGVLVLWFNAFSGDALAVTGVLIGPAVAYGLVRYVVRPVGRRLIAPAARQEAPSPSAPTLTPVPAPPQPAPPDVQPLGVHEVAATAWELEACCKDIAQAQQRLSSAREAAEEEYVEDARRDYVKTSTEMSERIREVGRRLHEHGGEQEMRRVLDRVERPYRATVLVKWSGIGPFS